MAEIWDHVRRNGPQLSDYLPCLFSPAHMGVAGGKNAIRLRKARIFLDRQEKFRYSLVKPPSKKMCGADIECGRPDALAGAEAQRHFEVFDSGIMLACIKPHRTADMPTACRIWVECQCAINQGDQGFNVFVESCEDPGSIHQNTG